MNWTEVIARTSDAASLDDDLALALMLPSWRGSGMTHCPAHEDRQSSLSWRWSGHRLLLHCFAGCTWDEIRAAADVP